MIKPIKIPENDLSQRLAHLGLQQFQGSHRRVIFGQTHSRGMGLWQPQLRQATSNNVYGHFNLALHVGDDAAQVQRNRQALLQQLQPLGGDHAIWLNQVHGTTVYQPDLTETITATADFSGNITGTPDIVPDADAATTTRSGRVLTSLTADCLPVVLVAASGGCVGIAHAGWRGLLAGVIEATAAAMAEKPVFAWLGAAIGPQQFEVGPEVRQAFMEGADQAGHDSGQTEACFVMQDGADATGIQRYRADIFQLARLRLQAIGIGFDQVKGGGCDTVTQHHYYSYRRQPVTGRMASLVFIQPENA